jgi:hypothetical protein
METILGPAGQGLNPTETGWEAIYIGGVFLKSMYTGDKVRILQSKR